MSYSCSDSYRHLCRSLARLTGIVSVFAAAGTVRAGGGPANVMVLYNADDPNATGVATYYGEARSLLPGYLCGIKGVDKTKTTIDFAAYKTLIGNPLDACLAALPQGQADDVDYLVLVRGLPYLVNLPAYGASLEAVLQVHHVKGPNGMELAGQGQTKTQGNFAATIANPAYVDGALDAGDFTVMNPYSSWYVSATGVVRTDSQPAGFRRKDAASAAGRDFAGNLFIVSRLDGFDYSDARALVDRAVMADGTLPKAEILCMQGEDQARAARDPECEFTTRLLKGAGFNATYLAPFNGKLAGHTLAAYFSGSASTIMNAIAGNTFVPGAITDNLTSVGAATQNFFCSADGTVCPAAEAQTSIARYVRAGATGAHGMVIEPLNNAFPNAGALVFYTFGYSLGESYFFSQRFLYWQNIHLGDPLATPYARRPLIQLPSPLTVEAGGMGMLTVRASHAAGIAQMTLYVGGVRVAQSQSDSISFAPAGSVGTKLDVLVTAVAKNELVMRPGWPVTSPKPSPDVQGWATAKIEIVPAVPHDMAIVDAGPGTGAKGTTMGGCRMGRQPINTASLVLLVAAGLLLGRRRRRGRLIENAKR